MKRDLDLETGLAADYERHIPMFETPNLDGKIPCLCGERFATWRDWCRHRGEQSDGQANG